MSYACLFHEVKIPEIPEIDERGRYFSTEQKIRDSPFPRGILEAPLGPL